MCPGQWLTGEPALLGPYDLGVCRLAQAGHHLLVPEGLQGAHSPPPLSLPQAPSMARPDTLHDPRDPLEMLQPRFFLLLPSRQRGSPTFQRRHTSPFLFCL